MANKKNPNKAVKGIEKYSKQKAALTLPMQELVELRNWSKRMRREDSVLNRGDSHSVIHVPITG